MLSYRLLFAFILMLAGVISYAQAAPITAWGRNDSGQCNVPASLADVAAIDGGNWHSLALKADGTVAAWGDNTFGQGSVPAGITGITFIAAGIWHNLVLADNGTVVAWGDNSYGQCAVPADLSGISAVAGGYMHSLALSAEGTVVGWGSNSAGQRVPPAGLTGVVAIAAGMSHSLALKDDGTVVGWGGNGYGQRTPPAGLTGVIAIDTQGYHNLALKDDSTVVAWGRNDYGQCNVPAGLSGVIAIAAGGSHSLALKSDGTVVAWGLNSNGQSAVPADLGFVSTLAAGYFHNLALAQSNAPPLADAGADQLLEATGPLTTISLNGAGSTDPNGDELTYRWKDGSDAVIGESADVTVEQGVSVQTYTLTVADSGGLASSDTVSVTVQDTTPPEITVPLSLIGYVTCASGAVVEFSPAPSAVDLVDGPVPVACAPPSGSMFPIGTSEVICSAVDAAGNRATAEFPVHVIYQWSGLQFPGGKTVFNAGGSIALKFSLTGASAGLTDCDAALACGLDADGPFIPAGAFRYDGEDDQYVCNWKTRGLPPGAYWLQVDLGDDWPYVYRIELR
jgi:hypothetical protein